MPPAPHPPPLQALYKPYTRLPAKVLSDTSADGPLAIIAAACADFMKQRSLRRIDWAAPNLRKEVRAGACGGGRGLWGTCGGAGLVGGGGASSVHTSA